MIQRFYLETQKALSVTGGTGDAILLGQDSFSPGRFLLGMVSFITSLNGVPPKMGTETKGVSLSCAKYVQY